MGADQSSSALIPQPAMARLQSANDPMTIWFCASRPRPGHLWDLLVRLPRIAALFELRDNLIGGCVSLRVGKTFFQATHDFARTP